MDMLDMQKRFIKCGTNVFWLLIDLLITTHRATTGEWDWTREICWFKLECFGYNIDKVAYSPYNQGLLSLTSWGCTSKYHPTIRLVDPYSWVHTSGPIQPIDADWWFASCFIQHKPMLSRPVGALDWQQGIPWPWLIPSRMKQWLCMVYMVYVMVIDSW